jgi:hypothetical protein
LATLRLSTRQRVAVTRRCGLGAVAARSFRGIDPAVGERIGRVVRKDIPYRVLVTGR